MPFAATVLVGHLALLAWVDKLMVPGKRSNDSNSGMPAIEAHIIGQQPNADSEPIPEVQVHLTKLDLDAIRMVWFEDPDAGDISGVIGSASAPQLARVQLADADVYAHRAGLPPGQSATVLLVLEMLADGSVGDVSVRRSSGSLAADSAAIEYARLLRWTPGTIDHRAQAMRITFAVALTREG